MVLNVGGARMMAIEVPKCAALTLWSAITLYAYHLTLCAEGTQANGIFVDY